MKQRFLIGLVVIFGLLGARAAFSGPVTDLEASNDDGLIELSWTEPTDVDDTANTYTYVVERAGSVDFSSPDTFGPLLEGSDEYADGNTVNNETWYYRVGASTDTGTTYSYSRTVSATAYYPQTVGGLTITADPIICYETNGTPDSVPISLYLYAGPNIPAEGRYSSAKKVTITLLEAGEEIGSITLYSPITGTHTIYWDGSWGDMGAAFVDTYTWVATGQGTDPWIKHNGTYGMEATVTNYNGDEPDEVAESGALIGVSVVHFNNVVQEYTVVGSNPPAYVPPYRVTYQLTREAYVTIYVYEEDTVTGGLGTLVRRIDDNVPRPGEGLERDLTNTQLWDGKNDSGTIVRNGKYIMRLQAHEVSGCGDGEDYAEEFRIVWAVDILRLVDWSSVAITPDNPAGGAINYTLSHDANVTIAIYPEGTKFTNDVPETNPIIVLVDSGPRQAGAHTEDWAGLDSAGLLVPNAIYTYTISAQLHGVKAVDYMGNDCPFYSTIVVSRNPHKIDPPGTLTSLNLGGGNLQLTWTAPTNSIGDTVTYNIYRDTQPITTKNASLIVATLTNTTEWIDTGLPIGQNLYYRITTIDSVRPDYESNFSNMVSLKAPSTPTNLRSTTPSRHPTLTWEYPCKGPYCPREYGVSFSIYRSDTIPVALTETNRIASNIEDDIRTYTDNKNLDYDQTYYYVVTATNAEPENGLESNPSNERSHWSHFYKPDNLTAANENGPIRLNWTSAYGAGGEITYNIYRGSSLIKEGVETNTYVDDTVVNLINYCYQVVAVDSYDDLKSDTSNQACAVSAYPYTPKPTGLSATCVNRGINLTWDQLNSLPTVSYTYNVYRSLEPWVLVGHTAELMAENLVFSQYQDEGVQDSTTYYYRVSAVNVETELEGDPSDTVSATSLFSPPTGLTATNDNGVIDLAWTATGGFGDITYNIYHDTDPSVTTASDRVATGISVTHWTDINTDSGTTYWYIVTGVDAFDNLETDASDSASTTSIYPSDARPQKLRAECVNRAIGLTWEPHSTFTGGAVLYTIHRGTSSPLTTVVATNVSDTTWTDTNVDNQITYYYHITADTGPGNPSNEAYATSSFSAPTNLVATNNNGLSINLSWNHTSGFGSITYNIYRDLQSTISTSSPMIATGLAADTYSDTDLVFGTQYYYLVTGVDSRDNVESLSSLPAHATATHIQPSIASISMTGIALEADSAIITYTVTNGPARQVEITIIDQQTGQEVATIIQTENQDGVCTASWDGIWTSEQGTIKHNGRYSAKAQAMDVDNSLSDWTATTSDAWVDVVHIQQPVTIEYTTEGENPPVLGPNYHITYQLTKGAYVVHKIYTDTGALVRTISSDVPRMGEGFERDITVTDYWDLRATNGSFVPNGIYHWQITAYYQGDTSTVTFDLPVQPLRLTDLTTVGIAQSEDKAQINYTLTTDATVTIKIYAPGTTFTGGLDDNGNPIPEDASALVKTLTFSRGKGSHTESWDGTNDTGQVVANDIYMMSIIALDSHRNRAVDYNGSECPFYGTIPVYRGVTPPTLSWTGETGYASDGVNPDKDKAGDTFTYRISYAHQDNTPLLAPPTLHIFKGGTEIDTELMTGVDPYDQTYSDSKLYTVDVSLTDTGADYSYYFEARDINGIPATGIPTRSIVGYMKNGPIVDNTPLVTINQIDRGGFPEIDCYVTVTDQAGDHLGGLISGDFTVTEGGGGFDGTPNTVGSPTAALSTALVMDYSGSMLDPDVVNAEAAANIFVNNMADTDRAAVVKFDETVSLIRGFTSNKGLLRNAISTPYSRGATAFYDAVYLGLEETAKQQGRKAIIAFTDGLDNSSTYTVGEVVTYAKNNSIPVFTIGLGEADEQVLTSMAQGTGGKYYSAPTSAELITIFEEISTALSNQYLVSYRTTNDTPDGQLRDVTISVKEEAEDGKMYQSPPDTSAPTGAPNAPTWTAGQYSSSLDITCTWGKGDAFDTGSGIAGYYLEVATDPTFAYGIVFDDRVGNVSSYKIENLTDGRIYYARVKAENGSGLYSNWSGISKGIRIVTTLTNLTVSSPNIEPLSGLPLLASEGDSIAISFESFKGAFKEVVVTITDVIKKEEAAVLKVYDLPSHGDTITTIYWNGIWTEGGGWHKHNSCYSVAVEAIEYGDTSTVIAGGLFCVDVVHIQLPVLIEYTTSGEKPPVIVPSYKLTYQLTKDAYVTHSVYTDTGLLVRTIESNTPRIGEWLDRDQKNVAFWDMRSHDGSLVPNGIYYWEIMATDGEDTSVPVYVRVPVQPLRLTDLSAVGISEDGGEGGGNEAQINYTMTASAAVTIKIYEPGTKFTGALDTAGNPVSSDTTALVRTLGPFSRGEGSYSEIWNGRDNDGHLVDNGIYIYSITATDAHGNRAVDLAGNDAPFFGDIPVQQSAEEEEPEEPEFSETTVYAYPNPVMVSRGDVVTFRYALSEAADVTIKVYTITGEILWEKEILNQSAGIYKNENWDVRNKGGKSVASGLYIYSVQKNDDKPIIKKLIVIR